MDSVQIYLIINELKKIKIKNNSTTTERIQKQKKFIRWPEEGEYEFNAHLVVQHSVKTEVN